MNKQFKLIILSLITLNFAVSSAAIEAGDKQEESFPTMMRLSNGLPLALLSGSTPAYGDAYVECDGKFIALPENHKGISIDIKSNKVSIFRSFGSVDGGYLFDLTLKPKKPTNNTSSKDQVSICMWPIGGLMMRMKPGECETTDFFGHGDEDNILEIVKRPDFVPMSDITNKSSLGLITACIALLAIIIVKKTKNN